MYIFLIKVNFKLNLGNILTFIFFYSFCQIPEVDKGHKHVLAAKFYSREITSFRTAVTQADHIIAAGVWTKIRFPQAICAILLLG